MCGRASGPLGRGSGPQSADNRLAGPVPADPSAPRHSSQATYIESGPAQPRLFRHSRAATPLGGTGLERQRGPSQVADSSAGRPQPCPPSPPLRTRRSRRRQTIRGRRRRLFSHGNSARSAGELLPFTSRWWNRSRRYQRLAAERKRAHGELANRIVGQGNVVKTEKIPSVAFQKSFARSVKVRAPGGLVAVLRQKTAATGGDLVEFPTRTTRLKVRSHDRHLHEEASLPAGPCAGSGVVQRDLYSAFLARFVEAGTLDARSAAEAFRNATAATGGVGRAARTCEWGGFPPPPHALARPNQLPVEEKRRRRSRNGEGFEEQRAR